MADSFTYTNWPDSTGAICVTSTPLGGPLPDVLADEIERYRHNHENANTLANELFKVNLPESSKEYNEHGYYILDSQLFQRLLYVVKPQPFCGCFVSIYDRLRKPQEYQSVQYYRFGWMCIAQDANLPEGDRLLQVGLMLRDHEREVLKTAYWRGSAWAKSPLKHIKKYLSGRKRKR